MSRLEVLQAVIEDPAGILSASEIAEYVRLCEAKTADGVKFRADALAEAAAEQQRITALHGAARIRHVLARQKRSA